MPEAPHLPVSSPDPKPHNPPQLPDILNAFINTGRVAMMQEALKCTWKLHW